MPPTITVQTLARQIELSEALQAGREHMLKPQDLPGRFGRVISSIDRVLHAVGCEAVLAGGWAVWRHGYAARVTQDVDVVLPADGVAEFLRVASSSGFDVPNAVPGRWPKVVHRETQITVDILPEGERPGTPSRPAPTTIPAPAAMGGVPSSLSYIDLPHLIELKLAAGRARDHADVVELLRANLEQLTSLRDHLAHAAPHYLPDFDHLTTQAHEADDR
jgi:hypothetical protein